MITVLELDVLVPERMALEVGTDKLGAALEKPMWLALLLVERKGARMGAQGK
jgi:hypothetical protein